LEVAGKCPVAKRPSVLTALPTKVATRKPNTKSDTTSRTRPIASSKRANRRRRTNPRSASTVLPSDTARAPATGVPVERLTRNAPIATPGHRRPPKSRSAASDSPVGGQTSPAFPFA